MSKLRVFESFSGVGSMSMALRNLGIDFELVGTSEVDRYAILAYDAIHGDNEDIPIPSKEEMLKEFEDKHIAYNFSSGKSEIPRGLKDIEKLYKAHIRSKNYGDIQLINPEDLPEMDLYTYSFPCKNISVAGQMKGLEKGSGTQSSLVWESLRIIEHCKPKYLLMENVKNLVSKKFKPYFDMVCEELERLGYNNYWSVLNGRDFDVPQNRERVMMLSIRKDIDKGVFGMPIGTPTTKCLKDVLDDDVEDRYYVPQPIMEKFVPNENFKTIYENDLEKPTDVGFIKKGEDGVQHQSNTVYDGNCVSCTLCAGDWKSPKMFMIENDKPIRLGGCFDEEGTIHQAGSVWEKNAISPTIDTMQGGYRQPLVITERIAQMVKVRKYEVDVEKLKATLKQAKKDVGLTINEITEKLNVTKTTVEHWFRQDECFSIPSEDIWLSLKELLKIETDEFDKSIMEWEVKPNEYDISNRVYNAEGLCPTLTTAGESGTKKIMIDKTIKPSVRENIEREINDIANAEEGKIYACDCENSWQDNRVGIEVSPTIRARNSHHCVYSDYKIRKLTPKECWRLMGFTDEDFNKAKDIGLSNTKLYERAGRGIVVPMLEEIFKNMMLNEKENEND